MTFSIRALRWVAIVGVAAMFLLDLGRSLPFKQRQEYGLVLLVLICATVTVVSLVLMPRASTSLIQRPDLLVPLALVTLAWRLLDWFSMLPGISRLLNPALPLRFLTISFPLSLHGLAGMGLGVAYATWMTAAVIEFVRTGNSDPCAVRPSALRWFWRVLGLEFIGWAVVFTGIGLLLLVMPTVGAFVLLPMLVGSVGWNLATAAVLPVALQAGPGFWKAFRAGVRSSLVNLRKWWLLLLAQMLLLGLFIFSYSSWGEGNNRHGNVSWNVQGFWIGGYDSECRWYGKLAEACQTSTLPFVQTVLALVLGAMAVAIKITIVQQLQPEALPASALPPLETPPVIESPDGASPPQLP